MSGEAEEKDELVLHVRSGGKDERVEKTGTVPSSGPVFRVNLTYRMATHETKDGSSDPEPDRYSDRFEVRLELGGKPVFELDSRVGLHLDALRGGLLPEVKKEYDLTEAALETGSYGPATVTVAATNVGDARYGTEVLATCEAFPFHELRVGDKDDKEIWGGATREGEVPCYEVKELQQDLRELGFLLVGNPDGGFGTQTEWAVREFQIYAGMDRAARDERDKPGDTTALDYTTHIASSATGHTYQGGLSGRVNERTYLLIQHWKRKKLRCPVVIVAKDPKTLAIKTVNLWGKDDEKSQSLRMYAYDFADSFLADEDTQGVVVGDYQPSGPRREGGKHATVKISAANFGTSESNSTFKAVKAAAEPECGGCLDSLNAWDDAFLSLGVCQWTMGTGQENGEIGGFLAFAASRGVKPFEAFGLVPFEYWGESIRSGQGTYNCSLGLVMGEDLLPMNLPSDKSLLQTWHWFYRFAMVAWKNASFQRLMWPMARLRIRNILTSPWPEDGAVMKALQAPEDISRIFTSEKAVACLLRWHVKRPSHIVRNHNASETILLNSGDKVDGPLLLAVRAVLDKALKDPQKAPHAQDPTQWTDDEEATLIEVLKSEAKTRNIAGIAEICASSELSSRRGSFSLDESDLPPASVTGPL